jgi:hypothetical protein
MWGLAIPTNRPIGPWSFPSFGRTVAPVTPVTREFSNEDLLAWFGEDERNVCGSCGEKACVSLPDATASFCLACDAITIDGQRIDIDRRIPI